MPSFVFPPARLPCPCAQCRCARPSLGRTAGPNPCFRALRPAAHGPRTARPASACPPLPPRDSRPSARSRISPRVRPGGKARRRRPGRSPPPSTRSSGPRAANGRRLGLNGPARAHVVAPPRPGVADVHGTRRGGTVAAPPADASPAAPARQTAPARPSGARRAAHRSWRSSLPPPPDRHRRGPPRKTPGRRRPPPPPWPIPPHRSATSSPITACPQA